MGRTPPLKVGSSVPLIFGHARMFPDSKTVNKDFRKNVARPCSSKVSPCASMQLDLPGRCVAAQN